MQLWIAFSHLSLFGNTFLGSVAPLLQPCCFVIPYAPEPFVKNSKPHCITLMYGLRCLPNCGPSLAASLLRLSIASLALLCRVSLMLSQSFPVPGPSLGFLFLRRPKLLGPRHCWDTAALRAHVNMDAGVMRLERGRADGKDAAAGM